MVKPNQIKWIHLSIFVATFICGIVAFPNPAEDLDAGQDFEIDDEIRINNYFGNLTGAAEIPKKIMQEAKNVAIKVKEHVQAAEKEINYIYAQLAAITEGQANFSKSFIHDFNYVKSGLRKSRQELRQLAQDTKTLTQDVKDQLDHEDELIINEVEVALSSLKELLKRTKIQITKAKLQYNNAIEKMNEIETIMKEKIVTLDELGDKKSDKYKQKADAIRGTAYGGCTAVTIGCIICDALLVCLGICSAAGTSACWAASVPAVEVSLAQWSEAIATFKSRAEAVKDKIEGLEDIVQKVTVGLENELDILVRWDSISGTLDSKLKNKNFEAKVLNEAKRIRKTLVRHVNELQMVAEEYLAQPASIFSDIDLPE